MKFDDQRIVVHHVASKHCFGTDILTVCLSIQGTGENLMGTCKVQIRSDSSYQKEKRLDHSAYSYDLALSAFHLLLALQEHSWDVTSKTTLRWRRLCDNSLHCRTLEFYQSEVSLNWLHIIINVSLPVVTMLENSERCIIHYVIEYFLFLFGNKVLMWKKWQNLASKRVS